MFLLIKIVIKLLQIRKVFTSEGGRELDQEGTQGGGVCIAVSVSVLEVGAGYTDTGFIVVKLYLYVSALFCVCMCCWHGPAPASGAVNRCTLGPHLLCARKEPKSHHLILCPLY